MDRSIDVVAMIGRKKKEEEEEEKRAHSKFSPSRINIAETQRQHASKWDQFLHSAVHTALIASAAFLLLLLLFQLPASNGVRVASITYFFYFFIFYNIYFKNRSQRWQAALAHAILGTVAGDVIRLQQ